MIHQDSRETFKSISLMAALEVTGVALAAILLVPVPVHAEARAAAAIECPRTIVSPEAQKKMDAGQKPVIVKSRYRPGLVNPQGFCTISLSPDGKGMFQIYNEAMSVGKIPVRFEYATLGLYGYAGEKGMPLGKGTADMVCYAPDRGESAVDCTISLTADGTMFFRRKDGAWNS